MGGKVFRHGAACAVVSLLAARAAALDGVPPFGWLPCGAALPELQAQVDVPVEFGAGKAFAGGAGERSLKVDRWVVAPAQLRYGLWYGLEAWAVLPFVQGSSPQAYTDYRSGGTPITSHQRLTGWDGGDPAVGARWRAWGTERGEDRVFELIVSAGVVLPLGTSVWSLSHYNYVTGPAVPDLASGAGAFGLAGALEFRAGGDRWRCDTLVGYIRNLEQEATSMEPPGSTINVTVPSPGLFRFLPAWRFADGLWLTGRVEGFAAARGAITTTGLLAAQPGSVDAVLDSYLHGVDGSSGLWAGTGLKWEAVETVALTAGFAAPVVVNGLYRAWRAEAGLSWSYKK